VLRVFWRQRVFAESVLVPKLSVGSVDHQLTRNRGQEAGDSPRAIRVTWPSEAVRVRDVSIALIHKRVRAPFYGPMRRCWSDQSPNAASWRAWLNRPTAGAGWLTGCESTRGSCCQKQGTTEYTETTEERHNRAGLRFRVFHLFRG